MSEELKVKKASKKAVMKSFLNWLFLAHSCYNYERLQGVGFLHAMSPIINDVYDKDDVEGKKEAMQRHTVFFNTEPRLGSMIVGLCAAMEERITSNNAIRFPSFPVSHLYAVFLITWLII